MNKQNIIKKVIAKLKTKKEWYFEGKDTEYVLPEKIKPSRSFFIDSENRIIFFNEAYHDTWLIFKCEDPEIRRYVRSLKLKRHPANPGKKDDKNDSLKYDDHSRDVLDYALKQGWVRALAGNPSGISNKLKAGDKDLVFEGTPERFSAIKEIVKKTTFPWENVWFNNKKYSLDLFLKRKVARQ